MGLGCARVRRGAGGLADSIGAWLLVGVGDVGARSGEVVFGEQGRVGASAEGECLWRLV